MLFTKAKLEEEKTSQLGHRSDLRPRNYTKIKRLVSLN